MALNPLRYTIVEDEAPARDFLKRLVEEAAPGSRCVGEAEDGEAGLALLGTLRPDLLFLDIEFPPEGAFGLLARARDAGLALPPIAFVTAYDQFALEAFRWAACDYLLKPVEPARLRETLARISPPPNLDHLNQALVAAKEGRAPERFTVRVKDRLKILHFDDVTHFDTDIRLVFAHTSEGRFVVDRRIEELERLLPDRFVRIHRGILANLQAIAELLPDVGHTSEVRLRDGSHLAVSRDRLAALRRRLA